MKKTRLIVLTTLILVALFAAVIPALAVDPWTVYNLSFQGDKNDDNIPDKWNVRGDVLRSCDHPYFPPAYDTCAMIFPPSNSGAAVWQRINELGVWEVQEEGVSQWIGEGGFGAKQMDWYRAYFGTRLVYHDGSKVVVYDYVNGGTYNFDTGYQEFYATLTQDVWQDMDDDLVKYYDWGVVTLPHGGYLAVDWIWPWLFT